MMGLEEHLLGMFRDDFEFNDEEHPSHLASSGAAAVRALPEAEHELIVLADALSWDGDAEKEAEEDPLLRARQGHGATPSATPPNAD